MVLSEVRNLVGRQVGVLVYEYRTYYLLEDKKKVLEGSTSLCSIAYAR